MQLIFAGKAHPADDGGKRLIQEIFWRSLDPRFEGRIAFAEDYDMLLASRLDAGVDVWLNNPRAPLEASGTSGMKAAANGALNLSVLDGWWIEGWNANHDTGWGIEPSELMDGRGDAADANAIYTALEEHVVPLYYQSDASNLPLEWIRRSKEAIRTLAPRFSSQRMVIEYINRLYVPASEGGARVARPTRGRSPRLSSSTGIESLPGNRPDTWQNRCDMTSSACGLLSTSMKRRPVRWHASPVVPLPAKKSRTRSPGREEASTIRFTMASGFWVG